MKNPTSVPDAGTRDLRAPPSVPVPSDPVDREPTAPAMSGERRSTSLRVGRGGGERAQAIDRRIARLAAAIAETFREVDDNGPRLRPCATPECPRFTRETFCLSCRMPALIHSTT